MEDLYNYIQTKKKIPNNSLIITFDDGYKNNYLYAYPTLNRNNCPASIFLVTGLVGTKKFIWYDELEFLIFKNIKQNKESVINVNGKEYKIINKGDFFKIKNLIKKNNLYERKLLKQIKLNSKIKPSAEDYDEYSLLNLKEIETMKKNNIMFYPHGHNHNILSKLNDKQLKEEVEKSINFIKQKNISKSVHFFAYPNGKKIDFDNRVTNILKQKNINYALTDQMGLFEIGQNQYELKRISMGETNDYYSFLIRLYFNLFL